MIDTNILRIPLYKLYNIDDLESFKGLSSEELLSFKNEYKQDVVANIVEALAWAKDNPNHDFKGMLPDLKFENGEIYDYLVKIWNQLKHIE